MSSRVLIAIVSVLALLTGPGATARAATPGGKGKVFLSVKEALDLAFPGADVQRRTVYLSKDKKKAIEKLAGLEFESGIVFPYIATKGDEVVGTAYFDTHKVRTLRQTVMVVVQPDGTIGRIELLSFAEPREYIPNDKWYRQFDDKPLDDELNLQRAIKPVTGATLTARATTSAARRVLALHTFLNSSKRENRATAGT